MKTNEDIQQCMCLYLKIAETLKTRVDHDYGIAILQEIGKDLRMLRFPELRAWGKRPSATNDSATERQAGKDLRMRQFTRTQASDQKPSSDDEPATPNQIDYLRDLGATIPNGLTKKKASELIETTKQMHVMAKNVKVQ